MQRPMRGEPHRPSELQVGDRQEWQILQSHFEELGIGCVLAEELDLVNEVLKALGQQIAGQPQPGLLDMPGVGPRLVRTFFEAAADFYRAAPWRLLGYEVTLKVECTRFQSGPWYGVVIGQSGMTLGLALYDDLESLTRMQQGDASDEENARQTVALTLIYGEQSDQPVTDLEAIQKYGWVVAGPEAYPSLFRKEPGLAMRPPLAWELELMTGCLQAIPTFVTQHSPDDPVKETVRVSLPSGDVSLMLSWLGEL